MIARYPDEVVAAEYRKRRLFTEKKIMIAQMTADGLPTKIIAKKLKLSPRTIEAALDNLRIVTDTNNKTHLIAELIRLKKIK